MTLKTLRRKIAERGGLCEIWLVYEEDRVRTISDGEFTLRLVRALWSRAEAIDWARAEHQRRTSFHYHVYRVAADEEWVSENTLRRVRYVASFEDAGERPALSVTPGAVAHAFG